PPACRFQGREAPPRGRARGNRRRKKEAQKKRADERAPPRPKNRLGKMGPPLLARTGSFSRPVDARPQILAGRRSHRQRLRRQESVLLLSPCRRVRKRIARGRYVSGANSGVPTRVGTRRSALPFVSSAAAGPAS